MHTALFIPTYNAENYLARLLPALSNQTLRPDEVLIIDSSSSDRTVEICRSWGARVEIIPQQNFNHGGTRRLACDLLPEANVLFYMTQDAIPANQNSLSRLYEGLFIEKNIGLAYGRQIPHDNASILAQQSRAFNYPSASITKKLADAPSLGIKTCFNSDSFAAYHREALVEIGGFPRDVIGSEDAYVAAKMLLAGYSIRYESDAIVQHSHNYSILQEFRRYFDIGVFYGREKWIESAFGNTNREGIRFFFAEINALIKAKQGWQIPNTCLRTALKFLGYKLGQNEHHLILELKKIISMSPSYWKRLD